MDKPFDAIIFDLGRVLVSLDLSPWTDHLFCGRDPEDTERTLTQIMSEELIHRFFIGRIDGPQFHKELVAAYGVRLPYPEFVRVWHDIFRPMEGMEPLVARLQKTYRLGLLSDTDPIHWQFLSDNYPILRHFANPTLSFRVGAMKPDPRCTGPPPPRCRPSPSGAFILTTWPAMSKGPAGWA